MTAIGSEAAEVRIAVERAYRKEWTRIVATLISAARDWDVAEEAAADAFERAAERWPTEGVPRNTGAWLTTVARNRALDILRRRGVELDKVREWIVMDELRAPGEPTDPADIAVAASEIDDRLRLIFTCAHPALSLEARVALTLRTVAGLETGEIARAFLVPEATMAQRLVRAKRKIRNARIPYRVPDGDDLRPRLDGVLSVLMLVHNEGYLASSGDQLLRVDLQDEAIRLARLVVDLMPDEPEPAGLLALLLLQHSRSRARVDEAGDLVPLDEQDRTRWNAAEIAEGLTILDRLDSFHGSGRTDAATGPYRLQAEIQRVHARAATTDDTDWAEIVRWYDALIDSSPSPVLELNRAVAHGLAGHPQAALDELDRIAASGTLSTYHLLPAAQADMLRRLGRRQAAAAHYRRALSLAPTEPERRYLERRLAELAGE